MFQHFSSVRLREDSLQLPRPNPVVQQQARPLQVTAASIHNYGFKQAYFAGPSDATHAIAVMLFVTLLLHAIAARTGPNPADLWARQTLHEI